MTLSGVFGSPEPRWTSTQVPEARVSGTFRSFSHCVCFGVCVRGAHYSLSYILLVMAATWSL